MFSFIYWIIVVAIVYTVCPSVIGLIWVICIHCIEKLFYSNELEMIYKMGFHCTEKKNENALVYTIYQNDRLPLTLGNRLLHGDGASTFQTLLLNNQGEKSAREGLLNALCDVMERTGALNFTIGPVKVGKLKISLGKVRVSRDTRLVKLPRKHKWSKSLVATSISPICSNNNDSSTFNRQECEALLIKVGELIEKYVLSSESEYTEYSLLCACDARKLTLRLLS